MPHAWNNGFTEIIIPMRNCHIFTDNIIEPNEDEPGLGKILVPGKPLFLQCKTEECPYCSIVWYETLEI